MSKFHNPVEIKIQHLDLIKILTNHMNTEIFREEHQVQDITMHVKGNYAVTMIVDPVKPMKPGAQVAKEVKGED